MYGYGRSRDNPMQGLMASFLSPQGFGGGSIYTSRPSYGGFDMRGVTAGGYGRGGWAGTPGIMPGGNDGGFGWGNVLGGILGGAAGSQMGGGNGRLAMTGLGSVIGALFGPRILDGASNMFRGQSIAGPAYQPGGGGSVFDSYRQANQQGVIPVVSDQQLTAMRAVPLRPN